MNLSVLRRIDRCFQRLGWDRSSAYGALRLEIAKRLAGTKSEWLNAFFSADNFDQTKPLPGEIQQLVDALPVASRPGAEGLGIHSIAAVSEFFAPHAKTQGVFYTPWPLARRLARQVLQSLLMRRCGLPASVAENLLTAAPYAAASISSAPQIDRLLKQLTVCDPAAGAGGLLLPFSLELAALRQKLTPNRPLSEILYDILTRNLYAGDISAHALDDLQLGAALLLTQYGKRPASGQILPHLLCGDSLAVREQKSVWRAQFPQLFNAQNGFDLILSNPPYLGQKNHRRVFDALRRNPLWRSRTAPKSDLLYFFFYLALDLLKEGGIAGFLTTAYFSSAAGAQPLRRELKTRAAFLQLEDFGDERLFRRAAGQHNLLSVFEKNHAPQKPACQLGSVRLTQEKLYQGEPLFLQTRPPQQGPLPNALAKMAACPHALKEMALVSNGLMTGCDKISAVHLRQTSLPGVQKGAGVFVLSEAEKKALTLTTHEQQKLKPFFKNSDIFPYAAATRPSGWLIDFFYPNDRELDFSLYPHLRAHLARFAPLLLARKQNNNGIDKLLARGVYWFGSVRRRMNFEADKIAVPQRAKRNTFGFAPGPWYASSDVYFISRPQHGLSLWYLLGLFNSAPYFAWLFYQGKRKGRLLELYSAPLNALPVPLPKPQMQRQVETLAQEMYRLKSQNPQADISALQARADELVGQIFQFTPAEQQAVRDFSYLSAQTGTKNNLC